jgi:hypothetical protein
MKSTAPPAYPPPTANISSTWPLHSNSSGVIRSLWWIGPLSNIHRSWKNATY